MIFCYADPPYLGQGKKLYGEPIWDQLDTHRQLVAHLERHYPDGWVMSCSSPSLRQILPLCPEDARVASWVKPFAIFKPNVNPAYAWEPLVFRGGRRRTRSCPTIRDWVSCNITLRKGLTGAKPEEVCAWIVGLLGAIVGDRFDDLFPGTGVFGRVATKLLAAPLTSWPPPAILDRPFAGSRS